MSKQLIIATVWLFLFSPAWCDESAPGELPPRSRAPQEAVEAWKDMRYGMFIHWGPVALTGHEIGWSRGRPGGPSLPRMALMRTT